MQPLDRYSRFRLSRLSALSLPAACFFACLFACLFSATLFYHAAWAEASNLPHRGQVNLTASNATVPLVQSRKRHSLNHIYQFESSPLGERVPVILIPGRAEEFQNGAWWSKFRKEAKKNAYFQNHCKLYAFIYDSRNEVSEQSEDFTKDFMAIFGPEASLAQKRKPILIGYSLGGIIARTAMEDDAVYDRVEKVIAIAVPFHGSPIFDPDWFTQFLAPGLRSPIRAAWDRAIYRFYLFDKSNLRRGLSWDNFDHSKPQFKQHIVKGDMVLPAMEAYREPSTTPRFKEKLLVYASYLPNHSTEEADKISLLEAPIKLVQDTRKLPKAVVGSFIPFYGFSVHAVFDYTNLQLNNIPTYTPDSPEGKVNNLYRYNDGVIPLSSMLFLPARKTPYSEDLEDLLRAVDVPKVRLFYNLNHMHIGDYIPPLLTPKKINTQDMCHPSEGKHTPNQWLLHDLKNYLETGRF